jgi:hypothetical protein
MASGASVAVAVALSMAVAMMVVAVAIINADGRSKFELAKGATSRAAGNARGRETRKHARQMIAGHGNLGRYAGKPEG